LLPNFLIIGAAKSGTTSLFSYLSNHPDVFLHPYKELRYFVGPKSKRSLGWYEGQFDEAQGFKAVGEASNGYTKYPLHEGAPERIKDVLPDVKLLYIIREPMARIRSHWHHRHIIGKEKRSAADAVAEDPIYRITSLYGMQIARYYQRFPANQIKVVAAENIFADTAKELEDICRFLGVPFRGTEGYDSANVSSERVLPPPALAALRRQPVIGRAARYLIRRYQRHGASRGAKRADSLTYELPHSLERELRASFEEDRQLLESLTGQDFSFWD
jgi:hypothetical protein